METIKITQFKRIPKVGAKGPYTLTMFVDSKNRKMSTFADSTNWKIGDEIEMEVTEKLYNGTVYLNATLPSKKSYPSKSISGAVTNPLIEAYKLAIGVAPILYKDKKAPKLAEFQELVLEVKKFIEPKSETPTETKVPTVNLEEEVDEPVVPKKQAVQQPAPETFEEDDDTPF